MSVGKGLRDERAWRAELSARREDEVLPLLHLLAAAGQFFSVREDLQLHLGGH
jgi:hypothetical protein